MVLVENMILSSVAKQSLLTRSSSETRRLGFFDKVVITQQQNGKHARANIIKGMKDEISNAKAKSKT